MSPRPDSHATSPRLRRTLARAILTTAVGGLVMNLAPAASSAEARVIAHLHSTFGVPADALAVRALTPRDLPAGAAEYYAEVRGSQHDNYNVVAFGDKMYSSRVDGDFERVLREQALLTRSDLTAAQLMRLYSLLALPRGLKYIDAGVLARNANDYRAYRQVQPPELTRQSDGAAMLVFFATPAMSVQPTQWRVAISHDGSVKVSTEALSGR
jgi:hypothetical protein